MDTASGTRAAFTMAFFALSTINATEAVADARSNSDTPRFEDFTHAEKLQHFPLHRPSGPSGFNTALVKRPPPVRESKIFILTRTLRDGRNAVVMQDLRVETLTESGSILLVKPSGLPKALTLDSGTKVKCEHRSKCTEDHAPTIYNDSGLEADQVRGDGIYSALTHFDISAAEADKAEYLDRLRRTGERRILAFTGREVVSTANFSLPSNNAAAATIDLRLSLPMQRAIIVSASPFPALPVTLPVTANPGQTLAITNPLVVADPAYTFDPCNTLHTGNSNPDAPWSFKTLLRGIASPTGDPQTARDLLADWVFQWGNPSPSTIGGTFPIGRQFGTISSYVASFGGTGSPYFLNQLPFRLIGIFNRIDLAQASAYGPGSPGELRFVFGMLFRDSAGQCQRAPMTVILEYKLPPTSCFSLKTYAKAWQALGKYDLNNPSDRSSYLADLRVLTDPVVRPNSIPGNITGSAISQIRTNEQVALQNWQLREFQLQPQGVNDQAVLRHSPLVQTPDHTLNATTTLRNYLTTGSGTQACPTSPVLILRERHCVPLTYPTMNQAFRGGQIVSSNAPWDGLPGVVTPPNLVNRPIRAEWPLFTGQTRSARVSDLRFKFAMNTCSGCHGDETGVSATGFVHVDPVNDNPLSPGEARVSEFLTGAQFVGDPVWGDSRDFNDLQRRAQALEAMSTQSCEIFPSLPLSMASPH